MHLQARFIRILLGILMPGFCSGSLHPQHVFSADEELLICPTEEIWSLKCAQAGQTPVLSRCATAGICDEPHVRDRTRIRAMRLRVLFHVLVRDDGSSPHGIERSTVLEQMQTLRTAYEEHQIDFELVDVLFHDDSGYACIPAYSRFDSAWLDAIDEMKQEYALEPEHVLNVFVTCQAIGFTGTVLGLTTFPWDPDALTARGGIWVNADFVGRGRKTLVHEFGHHLGLWHTHHGVDESLGCGDPCYEQVHTASDPAADQVGDFCKDTPATPVNFTCDAPFGVDCYGVAWGETSPTNYMGYGPEGCLDHFSPEQRRRMHCWTRGMLAGQLAESVLVEHVLEGKPESHRTDVVLAHQQDESSSERAAVHPHANPAMHAQVALELDVVQDVAGRYGEGLVRVTGPGGEPWVGATVYGVWSGATSGIQLAVTGKDGRARLQSQPTHEWPSRWRLSIQNVYLADGTSVRGAAAPVTAISSSVIRAPRRQPPTTRR